jgi:hypothetical protein
MMPPTTLEGRTMASTNVVNLDALIPREDMGVKIPAKPPAYSGMMAPAIPR